MKDLDTLRTRTLRELQDLIPDLVEYLSNQWKAIDSRLEELDHRSINNLARGALLNKRAKLDIVYTPTLRIERLVRDLENAEMVEVSDRLNRKDSAA